MASDRGTPSPCQIASRLVQYPPSSSPSIGGALASDPVARTTRSASQTVPSAVSTRCGPVSRASCMQHARAAFLVRPRAVADVSSSISARTRRMTAGKSTSTPCRRGCRTRRRGAPSRRRARPSAAPSMGSQPKLAHSPPRTSRSAITTFIPAPASAYVTSDPVPPPPMTNTSTRSMRIPRARARARVFARPRLRWGPMYSADEIRSRLAGVAGPGGRVSRRGRTSALRPCWCR